MGKDDPKHIPLIGMDADYIGRSFFDFYSWGHIALGIASYLLLSLLITVPEALGGNALIHWWLIIVIVIAKNCNSNIPAINICQVVSL